MLIYYVLELKCYVKNLDGASGGGVFVHCDQIGPFGQFYKAGGINF